MQDHFGIGSEYFDATGCAIYTVETHLRYLSDVRAPATMDIETLVLGSGSPRKSGLRIGCWSDDELCATAEFMALHYNTRESRTMEMPELKCRQNSPRQQWSTRTARLGRASDQSRQEVTVKAAAARSGTHRIRCATLQLTRACTLPLSIAEGLCTGSSREYTPSCQIAGWIYSPLLAIAPERDNVFDVARSSPGNATGTTKGWLSIG